MKVFQDYAYYYNAFYQDKDYGAEAKTVDSLLKKYARNVRSIINLGCGTGRHDIELSKMGYQCTGIDVSPLMIDIARRNAMRYQCDINFEMADIKNYETEAEYDAVVSLFHVMSYQNSYDDILCAFKTARKLLKGRGGYFIFDAWYGPGVLSDKPHVRVKEVEDKKNKLVRVARPVLHDKEDLVDVNYEVFVIDKETGKVQVVNEVHKMRYFFRPEIEMLLEATEFTLIDNLDCQTLGETDYNTWTSYFIAKAK